MTVSLGTLPAEILFYILLFVPPSTALSLQRVSRRFNALSEPFLWRYYCRKSYAYWSPERQIQEKFDGEVNQFDWKAIFKEHYKVARLVDRLIDDILSEQRGRLRKAECIVSYGYDTKDALLRNLMIADSAEDVLARRYYSNAVLGLLHRYVAIQGWISLSQGESLPLERVLAGFDMFVLLGRKGDHNEISDMLDAIANRFRQEYQGHAQFGIRNFAVAVAEYLRAHNLIGIRDNVDANYHNMQNNFLGIALQDPDHPSLPLISVAIYCCVAQRVGLDARPCCFPFHVIAVVQQPKILTDAGLGMPQEQHEAPIYMDPFRSSSEMDIDELKLQLTSLGIPSSQHTDCLRSSSSAEMVRRSAKNIITSVETLRRNDGAHHVSPVESFPEKEGAFYASLWALTILADDNRDAARLQRSRLLPYIVQQMERHFPLDVSLIEKFILPLFSNLAQYDELLNTVETMRKYDNSKAEEVKRRTLGKTEDVRYKIGQHFQHRRYNYFAVIIGWDVECLAGEAWISQMGVYELARGKHQSFYHAMVEDGSSRYVAEDNIKVMDCKPSQGLMTLAGQYFKRWDTTAKTFVSNIRDQYPDD